jgi:hypothetical protein
MTSRYHHTGRGSGRERIQLKSGVVVRGRWFPRDELTLMLDSLRQPAAR